MVDHWINALLPNMTSCGSVSAIRDAKTAEHIGGMSLDIVEVYGVFVVVAFFLAVAVVGLAAEWAIRSAGKDRK